MTERSLSTWVDHLRGRLPIALGAVVLGAAARLSMPAPPARTTDAIAEMLGDAIGGAVSPDDFIWEERGGFLHDALLGRRVLFLGAPDSGRAPDGGGASIGQGASGQGAAELYRARVRLTRSGRPVSLGGLRNLTDTPLGDDRNLVAHGRRVAVTTSADGVVQGITLLDLGGDAELRARPLGERLRAAALGWLEVGAVNGASRTEISFDKPPSAARLDLVEDALVMALGPDALPAALDLTTGQLDTGGNDPFGARVHRVPHCVPSFVELAERSAGRLLGPGAAAAVERLALAAGRIAAAFRAEPDAPPAIAGDPPAPEPVPPGLPSLWPPPPVAPAVEPPLPGEGVWVLLPAPPGQSPPGVGGDAAHPPAGGAFATTFVRPNPEHPGRRVHLLAIDTRRIGFDLQAGFEAPRPTMGPRGTGTIPERALPRIVGAIGLGAPPAGSAPSGAGALGMRVEGRTLVPPAEGAATLAVDRSGRPFFGAWPSGGGLPDALWALWQGPALFDAGAGAALSPRDDDDLLVERAALCTTERGFVIHAWGKALDAATLSAALRRAGCAAGLSLGRAPSPLGVALVRPRDGGGLSVERLSPAMSLVPERLVSASPDAFIYLVSHGAEPVLPLPDGLSWTVDGAAQPYPTWMPAVHSVDVVHLGARVRISTFPPDRFVFRLRAGSREISPRAAPKLATEVPADERARVLAAIGVGTGRRRNPRGLAVAGTVGLRFRGEGGLLVVRDGRVEIHPAGGVAIGPDMDATELPLTADDGSMRPAARQIGRMRRRGAACVLPDGTLVTATTTFDSDEATTEALLDLGCARVVALDRGAHRNAFVHRASGDPALKDTYEETTLFAVGVAMSGRARRLTGGASP